MKPTVNIFITIWEYILDLIFPMFCVGCKKKGEIICHNCLNTFLPARSVTESGIIALFDYRDPLVKKLIWHLKYFHHYNIGNLLGKILFENLVDEIAEIKLFTVGQLILVIPVPISRHKTKVRGYNQALKIASGFIKRGNIEECNFELGNQLVTKLINTIPQAKITNRTKRLKNVVGVFKITDETKIKGRTIIIIDDVTTTGGTIKEIMKILKKAGARKVIGFAVAH